MAAFLEGAGDGFAGAFKNTNNAHIRLFVWIVDGALSAFAAEGTLLRPLYNACEHLVGM